MLMLSPLKSMQQIATLIITFLVYVECIRNSGSSGGGGNGGGGVDSSSNSNAQHNYESNLSPIYSEEDNYFAIQQSLSQMSPSPAYMNTASNHQSNEFRPSQIIDFTTSDATALHRYPPSYLEPDYKKISQIQRQQTAQVRYDIGNQQQQLTFPNEQYAAATAAAPVASNAYNHKYQTGGAATTNAQLKVTSVLVPTQLQSTPILTYRDPYTNENHYHYTPTEDNNNNNNDNYYYNQYQRQQEQPVQYQQQQPQEYTVQSSLLVDSNNNNLGYQQQHHQQQQQQQQQTTHRIEYQRPGYVFDEQLSPSYERPINANKYAQYQQQQLQQQQHHSNAIPNYNRELPPAPPLRRPATTSQKPSQRLSYDSHDYPPPSYLQQQPQQQQQQQQQQISNFQSPQRQDTANYASPSSSASSPTSSSPNYANNFGNYLQGEQYYQTPQNYKRPPPHFTNDVQYASRPPQKPFYKPAAGAPPPPPSYNNYYDYQQGEIPPPSNYPNYRPPYPNYRPPPQIPQQQTPSGLESLVQYAPQFTNLLLGTFGGGGGGGSSSSSSSSSSPLGSLLGAFTGGGGGGLRPPNMQLIKALENIARNDDLQCVPKVLCQMIAGQTERGQLPNFITSPAITNFLAGFPVASPALIYGRAALLGISGGERSCTQSYGKCPKNEYEILHYLNNHRGGFFKFFSEPEEQSASSSSSNTAQQTSTDGESGNTSLFSILSALTGSPVAAAPTTTPRPVPKPTVASFDITNGIGSFFTNVLSEYLTGGGVEYQRRRRRSLDDEEADNNEKETDDYEQEMKNSLPEDFHDEEDDDDTHNGEGEQEDILSSSQFGEVEGRILHKELIASDEPKFFPQDNHQNGEVELKNLIMNFNKKKSVRKLKFPSATEVRDYKEVDTPYQFQPDEREAEEEVYDFRRGKEVHFKDDETESETHNPQPENYDTHINYISANQAVKDTRRGKNVVFKEAVDDGDTETNQLFYNHQVESQGDERRVIFPDHYDKHIRKGRILNNRPSYASSYSDYVRTSPADDGEDRFVLPNSHRRPNYRDDSNRNGYNVNNYNSAYYSQSSNVAQSNYAAHTNIYTNSGSNSNRGGNRYSRPAGASSSTNSNYPNYSSSSNSNSNSDSSSYNRDRYNYPNNNYVTSNRYSDYQSSRRTTRSPPPPPREDDKNVYVTDSRGVLSYYLTPDGRRVPY